MARDGGGGAEDEADGGEGGDALEAESNGGGACGMAREGGGGEEDEAFKRFGYEPLVLAMCSQIVSGLAHCFSGHKMLTLFSHHIINSLQRSCYFQCPRSMAHFVI